MTTLKVTIGLGDPQGVIFEDVEVIAGTGATHSLVPREVLERLNVPVWEQTNAETA